MSANDFEINIEYNKFDIANKRLILIYDIKSVNFLDKNISKQELETKIKKMIPKGEEKYISIKSFSTKYVSFVFDIDNWFKSKLKLDSKYKFNKFLTGKGSLIFLPKLGFVEPQQILF